MGKLVNPFASHAKDPQFEPGWNYFLFPTAPLSFAFFRRVAPRGPSQHGPPAHVPVELVRLCVCVYIQGPHSADAAIRVSKMTRFRGKVG